MGSPLSASAVVLLVLLYSTRSSAYIERVLENDSVCSLSFLSNIIYLHGFEDESALVIKDSRYLKQWTGNHDFKCRFTVSASEGLGVIAVIQRMSFRRDVKGNCIDFIQFRHAEKSLHLGGDYNLKIKSSEKWSSEICGKVNIIDIDKGIDEEDNDKAITESFIDHRGLIEVKIHIADKSLRAGEELSFEIVFTSFQECKFDNGLWKSCGGRMCIFKEFFQDGKLNCPFKTCKDESSCHPLIPGNDSSYHFNTTFGTKIMAGTVAGLLTMFVAFIAFLWLFRHCGTLFCCMGYSNSHPHSSEMQRVPNLDTMVAVATAPPDPLVASGTDVRTADKDLPPSYESLFPSK